MYLLTKLNIIGPSVEIPRVKIPVNCSNILHNQTELNMATCIESLVMKSSFVNKHHILIFSTG